MTESFFSSDPSDTLELHAIFHGRVQGVGFRAMVLYHAELRNLSGTVKNLADGAVELYAQGPKSELEALIGDIKSKSHSELVGIDRFTADYAAPKKIIDDFTIIH